MGINRGCRRHLRNTFEVRSADFAFSQLQRRAFNRATPAKERPDYSTINVQAAMERLFDFKSRVPIISRAYVSPTLGSPRTDSDEATETHEIALIAC